MKVKELMKTLQDIVADGNGDLDVYYRHGASGDCGEVGSPHVTNYRDESGPWDIDTPYVSLYVGN